MMLTKITKNNSMKRSNVMSQHRLMLRTN